MLKKFLTKLVLALVFTALGTTQVNSSDTYTGDLDVMLQKGTIRVMTTFSKTNFFRNGDSFQGFEYSMLKGLEDYALSKGYKVKVELIPVPRDQLIPALVNGHGDVSSASLTITKSRKKIADFTAPYIKGVSEVIVVHKSLASKIKRAEDLSGRHVFVRGSSSYFDSLTRLNKKLADKGLAPVIIDPAPEYMETEDILEMVNSGAIRITAADNYIAEIWASVLKDVRVLGKVSLRDNAKIAWVIRKGTPKLRQLLDDYISDNIGSYKGNVLFSRYYKNNPWIKNPLERLKVAKINDYKKLFRLYGDRFDFNWLVLMATAYEASGLDAGKRDGNYVGIMQVDEKQVTNKDNLNLLDPDVNIGMAAEIFAKIREQHFSEPGIAPEDKMCFVLAAYKSSPELVAKAREAAEQMQLDPNRWFGHVAIPAGKLADEETVRFVGNINKYYNIYKLALKLNGLESEQAL
jgi:membrane-bound lytic murein transglycosylase MltF